MYYYYRIVSSVTIIIIIIIVIISISHIIPIITTANLRTNIVGFRGFDSSVILILRGGILMSIGYLPESFSQAMLVGVMLVGKLGVFQHGNNRQASNM